ncbi:MAG TPA: VTT domain-containing protein [Bryobacteraceae bacterium]|nr:VTT domain-containing protein [Bryobacteraceae bacterium]
MVAGVDALVVLLSAHNPMLGYQAALTGTAGSLVGNLLLFFIARKGGEAYLHRHAAGPRGKRLRAWFAEYGLLTIFVPAFVIVPLPMKIFVLSAGAMGVTPLRFTIVLLSARLPRYIFLAWLGTRLGRDTIPYLQHHAWEFLVLAAVLFVVLYFAVRFLHDRNQRLLNDRSV